MTVAVRVHRADTHLAEGAATKQLQHRQGVVRVFCVFVPDPAFCASPFPPTARVWVVDVCRSRFGRLRTRTANRTPHTHIIPHTPSRAQQSPAKPQSPAEPKPSQAEPCRAQPIPAKPSRAQPNPAKPSRALPSPAKPNRAQPSPTELVGARWGEVGRGGPRWGEVGRAPILRRGKERYPVACVMLPGFRRAGGQQERVGPRIRLIRALPIVLGSVVGGPVRLQHRSMPHVFVSQ
jgi:hypothetical protein